MLKISILKVESPSCLWGRVVCSNEETMEHYINLQAQMNLFYHDLTQDLQRLKPKSLEEGQFTELLRGLGKQSSSAAMACSSVVIVDKIASTWSSSL
ncbi:hypothetical protein ILYODFUR_019198 [Ilyodon furcidens]|uniref:Uncharacterized protein n=1 Tax=Ilyodon furcidens TaxID=33524 RepID=A0ABV0V6J9_9TELE